MANFDVNNSSYQIKIIAPIKFKFSAGERMPVLLGGTTAKLIIPTQGQLWPNPLQAK
jgi:hypothetical protein